MTSTIEEKDRDGARTTATVAALRAAGHQFVANHLHSVSTSPDQWEAYNRHTFLAHRDALAKHPGKLRYLTYVTKLSEQWWRNHAGEGAVIL